MEEIKFGESGRQADWWGYGDYFCTAPETGRRIQLPYAGEPPHGDSYHNLFIESKTIRGYVWSGYLLWSACGRYFTCDWLEGMAGHFQGRVWYSTQVTRATVVIDTALLRFKVLLTPSYRELREVLRNEGEEQLWNTLFGTSGKGWEDFR